jgi:hypothetical protein
MTAEAWAAVATIVSVLFMIVIQVAKSNRSNGRIEEGVKGLYGRVDRVEKWIDNYMVNRRNQR